MLGQNAVAGIRNARLYAKAEERREAAEIFVKMAFTASASVHSMKNQMAVIKGTLQLLKSIDKDNAEIEKLVSPALKRTDEMNALIDSFHEPSTSTS